MSQGTLYESSPASVTNRPRDMRIDPATVAQLRPRRESKAWLAWMLLGMMAVGAIMGTWNMYQERYRTPAASQSGGHLSQPSAGAR